MKISERINKADEKIREKYLELVVRGYEPLFKSVKTEALRHMKKGKIPELYLKNQTIVFKNDGNFYYKRDLENPLELKDLAKEGINVQKDSYSIHEGIGAILTQFREATKKCVDDCL